MNSIFHCVHINAEADKVFEFLTTLDGLAGWWTTDATGHPYEGGRIRFGFPNGFYDTVKVKSILKNQHVTWEIVESTVPMGNEWIGTEINFDLTEDSGCTTLRFTHNKWNAPTDFFGVCNFQWAMFMNSLKSLCETGEGSPQVF